MTYNKRKFAAELILELEKGYDIEHLSNWANVIYNRELGNYQDAELDNILWDISAMSADPQFVITEEDLKKLILNLLQR